MVEMEERKRKYMAVAREVEEAVRDGKVSKKDAEKKLNALRKEMFRRDDSEDRSDGEMEEAETQVHGSGSRSRGSRKRWQGKQEGC